MVYVTFFRVLLLHLCIAVENDDNKNKEDKWLKSYNGASGDGNGEVFFLATSLVNPPLRAYLLRFTSTRLRHLLLYCVVEVNGLRAAFVKGTS